MLSTASSLAIVALLGAILIIGLAVKPPHAPSQSLVSVSFTTPLPSPPPPPAPPPPHRMAHKAPGNPAPQNLKNKATQIVAPPVVHPLIPPPPVVVAAQAGVGATVNTGASAERGPGQGAGGFGNGLGGGADGGDGDAEAVVGPRGIRDRLSYRDLPEGTLAEGQEATLGVQFTVQRDGAVTNCRIMRPSGHADLDRLTCRLIEQRFRYRPARDAFGRAVRSEVSSNQSWYGREE